MDAFTSLLCILLLLAIGGGFSFLRICRSRRVEMREARFRACDDSVERSSEGRPAEADAPDMEATRALLHPLTHEARRALPDGDVRIARFPFSIGRECRAHLDRGVLVTEEQRKGMDAPTNDLYLNDVRKQLQISRQHLRIERHPDGTYEVVDRGSKCGTIVGSQQIGGGDRGGRCPLESGDTITLGSPASPYVFRFVELPPETATTDR